MYVVSNNVLCVFPKLLDVFLNSGELASLTSLLEEAAASSDDKSEDWMRGFVMKHTRCSLYNSFEESTRATLDPERVYLFPCIHRNHLKECYTAGDGSCTSTEVTLRKAVVHYENMRKVHSMLLEATKAHKLLADLDAASVLEDLEYLSKLVRVRLGKPPDIGKRNEGRAREINSAGIEEHLSEHTAKDPSKSYREKFDERRLNVPRYSCISCNKLTVPSNIRKVNLDTWKVFKQKDDLDSDHPYVQLGVLLIQNLITISHEEEPGIALDEEILEEYDEAAAKSDNDDEEETTNQDHENRLLLNDLATLQF